MIRDAAELAALTLFLACIALWADYIPHLLRAL